MDLPSRPLGKSGLVVSALGLGCGQLDALSEGDCEALLSAALDAGVTLWDTARSYGASEERIGRHSRRREAVLSTKLGYGIDGVPDWTYECVARGVDRALAMLRVERLDVVHLHSCPLQTLEHGDVLRALEDAVRAGKVRCTAYSGENEALAWAAERFDVLQCSVSVCDQGSLAGPVARAAARGAGVLAKRPLANVPWADGPRDPAGTEYRARFQRMALADPGLPWDEVFVRFAAWAPGVSSALVGTRSATHLRAHVEAVARGPLPHDLHRTLREAFSLLGHCPGQI